MLKGAVGGCPQKSQGHKISTVTPKNETIRATDEDLIELTMSGDSSAFGVLWARHAASALTMARAVIGTNRSHASRDEEDLASEAFARVLMDLRSGFMPSTDFTTYLDATIGSVAQRWITAAEHLSTCTEAIVVIEAPEDTVDREREKQMTVDAFTSLPERWKTVLWHAEVESKSPAEVATLMNLSTNNATVLAFRARAGLRKIWNEKAGRLSPALTNAAT